RREYCCCDGFSYRGRSTTLLPRLVRFELFAQPPLSSFAFCIPGAQQPLRSALRPKWQKPSPSACEPLLSHAHRKERTRRTAGALVRVVDADPEGGGAELNLASNWRHWGRPSGPRVGAVVVW